MKQVNKNVAFWLSSSLSKGKYDSIATDKCIHNCFNLKSSSFVKFHVTHYSTRQCNANNTFSTRRYYHVLHNFAPKIHMESQTLLSFSQSHIQKKRIMTRDIARYYSRLNALKSKSSFLEFNDPSILDPQQVRFISGGVAIAVRNMKSFVRQGNLSGIMKAYSDLQEKFPKWAIEEHWIPLHIQILQTFSKVGEVEECDAWFRNNFNTSYFPNPSKPSVSHWAHYNTLMNAYANSGNLEKVLQLKNFCFQDVPHARNSVELHTTILKAHTQSENIENVEHFFYTTFNTSIRQTWQQSIRLQKDASIFPTIQTYCHLLSFYSKFGLIHRAKEVYDACIRDLPNESKSNPDLHNSIMEAYALSSGEFEMMSIFSTIFKSTLTAETRTNRLLSTTYTFIIMMEYYLKKGDPKSVIFLYHLLLNDKKLFQNLKLTPQPKLYALLLKAYLEIDQVEEAIKILYYRNIAYPTEVYIMLISYLADKGMTDPLRPVVKHMEERFGFLPNDIIPLIVSAYCKNDTHGAIQIFQQYFHSPIDTSLMGSIEASTHLEDLNLLHDISLGQSVNNHSDTSTPMTQSSTSYSSKDQSKLIPSEDLILQLLESMTIHDYLDLLKLWIDKILEKNMIPIDMDVLNFLLLTFTNHGHVESASLFAQYYFGNSSFVPNEKTIEIMEKSDILIDFKEKTGYSI